jgi:acyl-CoA synthetase (NDP forming)
VPEPSRELNEALNKLIPHCGSSRNPIDLLAMASGELFREVIKTVLDSRQYDAIIIIYLDPIANNQEHIPQMLISFLPDIGGDIPICITVVPTSTSDRHESYVVNELPIFPTPEAPAKCLAAALKSTQARSRSELRPRSIPIDTSMITEERTGWLAPSEVEELLKRNKLPILESFEAQSPKEAQQIATKLGSLVAIRASGPNILHKTELGAIRLNISQEQSELAANQISVHLQKHYGITPAFFTVQRMAQPGIELFIGMNRDPYFGPVIAFGAGGVNVEIFKDLKFAIPPINRDIIYKLLSELRIFPLLLGHRGAARSRIDSFIEMIEIICSLSLECTRIFEIDLNPILLSPNEALIIDARIRVISRTEAQGDPSLVHRS